MAWANSKWKITRIYRCPFFKLRNLSMQLSLYSSLLCLLAFSLLSCSNPDQPDIILYNARIVTLDVDNTVAEAMAIKDGLVVAVGTNEDILALGSAAEYDLAGRTVVPGLGDNHYHSIGGGPGVDLSGTRRMQDLLDAIAARAAASGPDEVIITNSNWHEGQLSEQRLPYRDDLDQAAPNHPVVVVRGGHEYILNSAGLKYWNITRSVPEPEGGHIGRYEDGRLNGELVDQAKTLVTLPEQPAQSFEALVTALADEYRQLNAAGLTNIRYAGGSPELYQTIQALKERDQLTVRVNFLFRVPNAAKPEDLDRLIDTWGAKQGDGDDWLRIGGVKMMVDGGYEGGWLGEPYEEPWGKKGAYKGLQTMPSEAYTQLVSDLNNRGWRVATHAVGDAAIDLVLDAYEQANENKTIQDQRWSIEHGFLPRADQFPRMRKLGLLVSAQSHLYVAGPSLIKYWGTERARMVTPVKTYLDEGILLSTGTDSPVNPYNPFWTLYHFITRNTINAGKLGDGQRIDRVTALRLSTLGNAALTFDEDARGSLESGKFADLTVLSNDILSCPENQIEDITVVMTIVGGQVVLDTQEAATGHTADTPATE